MMRIGELAGQTGFAPSTIRFHEADGLIGRFSLAEIRPLIP
jgi:hypothetical protein